MKIGIEEVTQAGKIISDSGMVKAPSQEKLEQTLDKIRSYDSFKSIKTKWDAFSQEDKLNIYKKGDTFSFAGQIKNNLNIINPMTSPFRSPVTRLFESKSIKEGFQKDFFDVAAPGIRIFVHLGLLDKPSAITNQELVENIKKDAKNIKIRMSLLEKAAMVIPELRPALSIIQEIKGFVDTSANSGEALMIQQQENLEKLKTNVQTTNELSTVV